MAITLESRKTLEVSAASGLIKVGENFYVVADDELSLLKFPVNLTSKPEWIPLFEGELPLDPKARKKLKPDFEALVEIKKGGPVLVLPSGSKPNRMRGALLENQKVTKVDFESLYTELLKTLPELNIEGSVASDSLLFLFQRGNGKLGQNALVTLDLDVVISDLQKAKITHSSIRRIKNVALGQLKGVNLSFTDAALESEDKIWFVAAAEATEDTYNDGEFAGAVLGALDSSGNLIFQEELLCPSKPEGLCLNLDSREFYVVTDSDDPNRKSELFLGKLP